MSVWPKDYMDVVLKDVEDNSGKRQVVKAGLIERCAIRHCAPEHLHPNPADEFSQSDVGPNFSIVGDYVDQIQHNIKLELPIFAEPVIVQKLKPEGYLLVNGHHRWFAAVRMRVKKLHIKIVNMISDVDVARMFDNTDNHSLVSIDFDEILLAKDEENQAPILESLFSRKIKERLRAGAPEIIREFQNNGFDVCVYTAGYFTEEDFEDFFSMYDLKINIVVNGVNEKRNNTESNSKRIQDMLRNRYKRIVHVDNESVICTDCVNKSYEIYDFEDMEKSWKDNVIKIISEKLG